jgi:hypothetical protein
MSEATVGQPSSLYTIRLVIATQKVTAGVLYNGIAKSIAKVGTHRAHEPSLTFLACSSAGGDVIKTHGFSCTLGCVQM